MSDEIKHLWEHDHPYYGSSYNEHNVDSFAELREHLDGYDEDMNFIYRWDWNDYSQPHHDDLFLAGEDRSKQEFVAHVLMPRKDKVFSMRCPITHEQEAEVLEWLRGARVLGTLRKWWEPVLGLVSSPDGDTT